MTPNANGTVLFLPLSKGNLLEMLPIAKAMRGDARWTPLFALDAKIAPLVTLLDEMSAVRTDGGPLKTPSTTTSSSPSKSPSFKKRIFSLLPSLFQALFLFRTERNRARKLLNSHSNIHLIIVSGDRNVGIETAVIVEGKRRGIPGLIVPFAMSFLEAAAEPRLRTGSRGGKYAVHSPLHRLLRRLFPSWVWVYKGVPLFFHPPWFAVAGWMLGIMPGKPWIIGGGMAKMMAVESSALRDQLLEQGMEPDKMIVTGKPSLDDIARQLASTNRDAIRQQLGIAPTEKLILCSVPNFAEHDLLPWDRHLVEMQFLFDAMAKTGAKVLLNLHPRSDRKRYQPLADKAGLPISDERIYTLLPACDILVTSYSSTVAQAVALCKPSVVVDFYGFDYPVYDRAPGAIVLRDRTKFFPTLQRLLTDHDAYNAYVEEQRAGGGAWAILDGKNTERVLELAQSLMMSC